MEIRKISCRRPRSVDEAELGHFTLLFCRGGKEVYKDLQRTCAAIVVLIKLYRHGLLKLPNLFLLVEQETQNSHRKTRLIFSFLVFDVNPRL